MTIAHQINDMLRDGRLTASDPAAGFDMNGLVVSLAGCAQDAEALELPETTAISTVGRFWGRGR